jgi:hypothetical protein
VYLLIRLLSPLFSSLPLGLLGVSLRLSAKLAPPTTAHHQLDSRQRMLLTLANTGPEASLSKLPSTVQSLCLEIR